LDTEANYALFVADRAKGAFKMIADDEAREFASAPGEAGARDERGPWHTPVIKVLPVAESENGVNSVTDSNNTFS